MTAEENFRRESRRNPRLPRWLRRPMSVSDAFEATAKTIRDLGIETICMNANCPNRGICWARSTASILILGNVCTRSCAFCSVRSGAPKPPDPTEPARVAAMAKRLGIKYLVITSVTRDDLPDGGASIFADCTGAVKSLCPGTRVETLVPDFRNCRDAALEALAAHPPDVFSHNVETVPQFYAKARPGADYRASLGLLRAAGHLLAVPLKSSIMLGLGETDRQVEGVLRDLRSAGCRILTIGQYLKPSPRSLPVEDYIEPAKFDYWRGKAVELGFSAVISEPFARSSYLADSVSGPW